MQPKLTNTNSKYLEHQKLVHEILLVLGALPHIRLWKNVVGFDQFRSIKYGLKGSADILGIVAPEGKFLAIEVKTGHAKQSKDQQAFQAMVEKMGGIFILARSVIDVKNLGSC